MTTVVYDGYNIASDSRCVGDFIHSGSTQKIYHYPETGNYFGVAGSVIPAIYIIDWINDGMNPMERPDVPDGHTFDLLWVTTEGAWVGSQDCLFMPIEAPFAIGSGGHLALGAMSAGADIDEAVRIASLYDVYTDSEVVIVEVEPKVKRKSNKKKKVKKS